MQQVRREPKLLAGEDCLVLGKDFRGDDPVPPRLSHDPPQDRFRDSILEGRRHQDIDVDDNFTGWS